MTGQSPTGNARLVTKAKLDSGSDKVANYLPKTICVDTNAVLGKLAQTWQQRLEQASADRGDETAAKTIRVDMESILSHMSKARSAHIQIPAVKRRHPVRAVALATIALLAVLALVFMP